MLTESLTGEIERIGDKRWKGQHRKYHARHGRIESPVPRLARIGVSVGVPLVAAAVLLPLAYSSTQDAPVWMAAEHPAMAVLPDHVDTPAPTVSQPSKPEYKPRHAKPDRPRAKSTVYFSESYSAPLPVKHKPVERGTHRPPVVPGVALPPRDTPQETDDPEVEQEPSEEVQQHPQEGEAESIVETLPGTQGGEAEDAGGRAQEEPETAGGGEADPLAGVQSESQGA